MIIQKQNFQLNKRRTLFQVTTILVIFTFIKCQDEETFIYDPVLPLCEITSPQNSDEIGIGELITISVDAWGSSYKRTIEVYLYLDSSEIASFNEHPYTYTIAPFILEAGEHIVKAVAKDDLGNIKEHEIVFSTIETSGESPDLVSFDNGLPESWYTSTWEIDPSSGINNSASIKPIADTSIIITSKTFETEGNITFNVKNNGGELAFYDNGALKASWFDSDEWSSYSYFITAGKHSFRWKSTASGISIDDVSFIEGTVAHTVGEHFGGGIIFYLDSTNKHGQIAAKSDCEKAPWGCIDMELVSGNKASSQTDGAANTEAIISDCTESSIAAKLCAEYVITEGDNTFNDWYLPAPNQLIQLYFAKDIVGNFNETENECLYWTSYSWYWAPEYNGFKLSGSISFFDGQGHGASPSINFNVRAIRSF